MKQLQKANVATLENCAAVMLETVPRVMAALRAEFRRYHPADLTVAQFRTLAIIHLHPGISLTAAADIIGLSVSAMSRLIATLTERGLIDHRICRDNRRQAQLTLTADGEATLEDVKRLAQAHVAGMLVGLTDEDCATVTAALQLLQAIFDGTSEASHV
jgi:DNA-binding MarR family transcriptional regulator